MHLIDQTESFDLGTNGVIISRYKVETLACSVGDHGLLVNRQDRLAEGLDTLTLRDASDDIVMPEGRAGCGDQIDQPAITIAADEKSRPWITGDFRARHSGVVPIARGFGIRQSETIFNTKTDGQYDDVEFTRCVFAPAADRIAVESNHETPILGCDGSDLMPVAYCEPSLCRRDDFAKFVQHRIADVDRRSGAPVEQRQFCSFVVGIWIWPIIDMRIKAPS
ncbi:hypothetical protein SAMCCGM7_pB0012 (plasmid) [Sinorhizobium americanum CCGM7]|nr:hypothetical protein SAMCCGM7_pB0012 [Sinorhizobium americanum CCGM7]OAP48883.1 hypothetical protein ATC00_12705 [Sinorhizobium americanum]